MAKVIRIADAGSGYKSTEELAKARRTGKEFGEGRWGFSEYPVPEIPKGTPEEIAHLVYGGVLFDAGYASQDTMSVLVDAPRKKQAGKPKEQRCSNAKCKSGEEPIFGPDPYSADVKNDNTPVWLCGPCRDSRAQDI